MAKSFYNNKNFSAFIASNAPQRSDRFEVLIPIPEALSDAYPGTGSQIVSLMCEEASLPGYSATNTPVKIGAWTEFRNQNLEFITQDVVFTFLSDDSLAIRGLFEKWIELTVSPVSKEVAWPVEVQRDLIVRALDRQDNVRAEYVIIDAIPKLVNINQLSWSNTALLRISVSFAARKWYRIDGASQVPDELKDRLQRTGLLSRIFDAIFD